MTKRRLASYDEFYRSGPYGRFLREERGGGRLKTKLILAQQEGHAFSDPASEDLVLGLTLGGQTPARWKAGGAWREIEARRPGALGVSPLGEALEFDVPEPHTLLLCAIRPAALHLFAEEARRNVTDLLNSGVEQYWYDQVCTGLLQDMWREAGVNDFALDIYLDGLTQALLGRLLRLLGGQQQRPSDGVGASPELNVDRLQEYIRSHLQDGFSVGELADRCSLSTGQLNRAVKRQYGVSPYQLIQSIRIEVAKSLMIAGHKPLAAVAQEVGFFDQSHFSRVFRRLVGTHPSAFLRQQR
ncbi:MAG: AraC family transcriptional regulator [Pseudomonadota bacterium]